MDIDEWLATTTAASHFYSWAKKGRGAQGRQRNAWKITELDEVFRDVFGGNFARLHAPGLLRAFADGDVVGVAVQTARVASCGIEADDGLVIGIEHLRLVVDLHAADRGEEARLKLEAVVGAARARMSKSGLYCRKAR